MQINKNIYLINYTIQEPKCILTIVINADHWSSLITLVTLNFKNVEKSFKKQFSEFH